MMKTKKTTRILLAVAVAALASLSPLRFVSAQTLPFPASVEPAFGSLTADDTDVALLIRYFGTAASDSGEVAVAVTTSDLTFTQGPAGSLVASTEFECPVSGALGGVIDVSNAACNTVGEVCDIINASTSWRCVPLDALRSDSVEARLVTLSATGANGSDGVQVKWDTSTAFDATIALVPPHLRKMSGYHAAGSKVLKFDPFADSRTIVYQGSATSTYGSGSSTIRFYSVNVTQPRANTWTEVVSTLYSTPGGATTAAQTFDFQDTGLPGLRGEKVIARLDNSAAMASVTFTVRGLFQRDRP